MSPYEKLENAARCYEEMILLSAAAELDIFTPLTQRPHTVDELMVLCQTEQRATVAVLDALTALGYLSKTKDGEAQFQVVEEYRELLNINHPKTFVPMLRHRFTCLRNWEQLSTILKSGKPAEKRPSILGAAEDYRSFILAMNSVGISVAQEVADSLTKANLLNFKCLLDVGGASGTYTLAILERNPSAKAILFDRPAAVAEAKKRIGQTAFANQVEFVSGDFEKDLLPKGADFAWVSAIIHQFGRETTVALYRNIFQALESGGTIAVRDFVMDSTRTQPVAGTLFAVNMLTTTENGMCYTLDEIREDLHLAGFSDVHYAVPTETMSAVVVAKK
jgi:hypothetical protein